MISTISSLAYTRWKSIYNMLEAKDDGSFNVTFPGGDVVNVAPIFETVSWRILYRDEGAWVYILEMAVHKLLYQSDWLAGFFQKLSPLGVVAPGLSSVSVMARKKSEIDSTLEGISAATSIELLTGNKAHNWCWLSSRR